MNFDRDSVRLSKPILKRKSEMFSSTDSLSSLLRDHHEKVFILLIFKKV